MGGLLRLAEETLRERVYMGLSSKGFPDLRPAHSNVLRNIADEGSTVSELAHRANMTKQGMGYLVDSLAESGYVTLGPDPTDGRAKRVRLSSKGRLAGEALVELSIEAEAEFGKMIGRKEMKDLRHTLERLADAILK